jgi:hypothetical protein
MVRKSFHGLFLLRNRKTRFSGFLRFQCLGAIENGGACLRRVPGWRETLFFTNLLINNESQWEYEMNKVGDHAKVICSLVNFTQRDRDLLQEEMEIIIEWIPEIVKDFFDTVYECPETRAIFMEGERGRLEKTLTAWIFDILSGYEDSEFWEYQWVIALVHMKRQVKNIHVAGMMNRIQQVVLVRCQETFDPDKAVQVFSAFLRITGITTALIVECYTELQEFITAEGLESVGVRSRIVARIRQRKLDSMMTEITTSRKDS